MMTLDTSIPSPAIPLLKTQGSGFPPQPIEAVWLSQNEVAVALSERWALIPNQGVRVMGPVNSATEQPEWQSVAKVVAIQPYLDGQRVTLSLCWGTIAANAAWLEGLSNPIDFLLNQHPAARPLQLLGQPVGVAQQLQGQGWLLTGTCVAGKQAVLKELLVGVNTGWVWDASGWYGSVVAVPPLESGRLQVSPAQCFELARQLCAALGDALTAEERSVVMLTATQSHATLQEVIQGICQAVPAVPNLPNEAVATLYWNASRIPSCWHGPLLGYMHQWVAQQALPVAVLVWPEETTPHLEACFASWQESGTAVVWLPKVKPATLPALWHYVDVDIAWPLAAMESDSLGSVTTTHNLPYDVAFALQGPTTWHLPVTWTLPGEVLPTGPVEWEVYGVTVEKPIEDKIVPLSMKAEPQWTQDESLLESLPELELASELSLGAMPDLSDLGFTSEEAVQIYEDVSITPVDFDEPVFQIPAPVVPPVATSPLLAAPIFEEGQCVVHATYGQGTVLQIIPTGQRQTVQVAFETAGTRLLDAAQGGLQLT